MTLCVYIYIDKKNYIDIIYIVDTVLDGDTTCIIK